MNKIDRQKKNLNFRLLISTIMLLVLVLMIVTSLFYTLLLRYERNTISEGAGHLVELNHQLQTNIENTFQTNSQCLSSLVMEINSGEITSEDELLVYLRRQKEIWKNDSFCVYNYDGVCIDESGIVQSHKYSLEFAHETVKNGCALHVASTTVEFSAVIHSRLLIRGKRIACISIVHNLDSLINNMKVNSFDDSGSIYLTRKNGVCISRSINKITPIVFNIAAFFSDGYLATLDGKNVSAEEMLLSGRENIYLYRTASRKNQIRYVVMTPVKAMNETWYIFYIIPEKIVNATMKHYSSYIALIAVLFNFLMLAVFFIFIIVYQQNEQKLNAKLSEQSHLFDILVFETNDVYMLLSRKRTEPLYVSSNITALLGINHLQIDTEKECLCFNDSAQNGKKIQLLADINKELESWDGKSSFVSGYIKCSSADSDKYIVLRFYPTETSSSDCIGIIQDVTVLQHHEDVLKRALALADSANRAKTKFLSSMSHDIRTPMNAIVNMTQFAEKSCTENDSKKTMEHLAVIKESSNHLLSLINDILDMSRIESGRLSFAEEPFNLANSLSAVCDMIQPLCDVRNQKFISETHMTHNHVIGDELRLNQVLINILNNAVKFTPEHGTVTFSMEELPSLSAESASYRLSVSDTGIGIAQENLKSIFEPFTRVENATVRNTEGTGLGLAITKRIVEAMGGSISVTSELGKGSVFTVELFFKIDSASSVQSKLKTEKTNFENANENSFKGKRGLIAEDNEINRSIASTILSGWGMKLDEAVDGSDLIKKFSAADAPHYDIIYSDIQMPVMDGYEAVKALRESDKPDAKTIPVVALTANVFAEDVEKARKAGMNAHVGKPLSAMELFDVTSRLLGTNVKKA